MSTSKRRKITGAQEVVNNRGVSRSNQDITEFSGALREAYLQQLFFAIRDDLRQKLLTNRDWLPFNRRKIRQCLDLLKDTAPDKSKEETYLSQIGVLETAFEQIAGKMKSNGAFCLSLGESYNQVSRLIGVVRDGRADNEQELRVHADIFIRSAESFDKKTILKSRFKAFTGALKGEGPRERQNTQDITGALAETSPMLPSEPEPASDVVVVVVDMWQKITGIVTQDSFQSKTGWRAIFNCFGVDRNKLVRNVTDAASNKNADQLRKAVYKFQKFWLPKKNLSPEIKQDLRMLNKYTALLSSNEVISEYRQYVPLPVNDDIGAGSFSFRSSSFDTPNSGLAEWARQARCQQEQGVAVGKDGQPAAGALLSPNSDPRGIKYNCDHFFERLAKGGQPPVDESSSEHDDSIVDRLVAISGGNVQFPLDGLPSIKCSTPVDSRDDPNPRRSFSFDPGMLPSFNPQTGSFSRHSLYRNGGGEVSGRNVSCDSTTASCH